MLRPCSMRRLIPRPSVRNETPMKLDEFDCAAASTRISLPALEQHRGFVDRHIGASDQEQAAMLELLGYPSRAALIDAVVPASIRQPAPLALAAAKGEEEALHELKQLAAKNRVLKSFIGQGYYGTYTPGVILRNVFQNPAWYTAYTPYQPEISQGRLEAMLNFQTMVCDLSGMAIANASMLDEATAAAEAMTLCQRAGKSRSMSIYVADDVLPQTIDVIRTRAQPLGITLDVGPAMAAADADCFAALVQYPGANGDVRDYRALAEAIHAKGALVIAAADLLALTMLTPPGEWDADGFRRSARRIPRRSRRIQAQSAGPTGWSNGRCQRPERFSARAANARTAHSSRKGDLEYLHGAGTARGAGEHVRRLPRAARAGDHRPPRSSPNGRAQCRAPASRARGDQSDVFRHADDRDRRAHRGHSRGRRCPRR